MVNPQQISILKKVAFVSDSLQKFGLLDTSKYKIKVNTLLESYETFAYALRVLNIQYESYTPDTESPEEINLSIGSDIDLKSIFYLTYLFKEIFENDGIDIYICYATNPADRPMQITIGSYLTKERAATNISRPIEPNEILKLNIDDMSWEEFSNLFPNINYSSNGLCQIMEESYNDNDDNCFDNDYSDYDEPYMAGDPRYDRDENPWIDVFGPGDEAETAYWNTD